MQGSMDRPKIVKVWIILYIHQRKFENLKTWIFPPKTKDQAFFKGRKLSSSLQNTGLALSWLQATQKLIRKVLKNVSFSSTELETRYVHTFLVFNMVKSNSWLLNNECNNKENSITKWIELSSSRMYTCRRNLIKMHNNN